MNAIKAGIVLKTTKSELEKLEAEQEQLEINIAMEKARQACDSAGENSGLADELRRC